MLVSRQTCHPSHSHVTCHQRLKPRGARCSVLGSLLSERHCLELPVPPIKVPEVEHAESLSGNFQWREEMSLTFPPQCPAVWAKSERLADRAWPSGTSAGNVHSDPLALATPAGRTRKAAVRDMPDFNWGQRCPQQLKDHFQVEYNLGLSHQEARKLGHVLTTPVPH